MKYLRLILLVNIIIIINILAGMYFLIIGEIHPLIFVIYTILLVNCGIFNYYIYNQVKKKQLALLNLHHGIICDKNLKPLFINEDFFNTTGYDLNDFNNQFKSSVRQFLYYVLAISDIDQLFDFKGYKSLEVIVQKKDLTDLKAILRIENTIDYICIDLVDTSVLDLVQEEKEIIELNSNYEMYKHFLSLSKGYYFEYNMKKDFYIYDNEGNLINTIKELNYSLLTNDSRYIDPVSRKKMIIFFSDLFEKSMAKSIIKLSVDGVNFIWSEISAQINDNYVVGRIVDVTDRIIEEENLKNWALRDPLTGLLNKIETQNRIDKKLDNSDKEYALMIFDIDNFKSINDTKGHLFGDNVIKMVAKKIKDEFDDDNIVGRIGGDEFIMLSNDVKNILDNADRINEVFRNMSDECNLSCSIGIAIYPKHGTTFQDLYKKADSALYITKKKGKNGFSIFDETIEAR